MLNVVFSYCYDECRYAECRCVECRYAECRYACRYAGCRYAECHYAECRSPIFSNKTTIMDQSCSNHKTFIA